MLVPLILSSSTTSPTPCSTTTFYRCTPHSTAHTAPYSRPSSTPTAGPTGPPPTDAPYPNHVCMHTLTALPPPPLPPCTASPPPSALRCLPPPSALHVQGCQLATGPPPPSCMRGPTAPPPPPSTPPPHTLQVQERQNRVCTTVAIAIVAETCAPFTVLPALMNEYRVPELNVQNGVLKALSFMFEYIGEMGKDYIYAVTPLLEDALMDRDLVHRQVGEGGGERRGL